MAETVASPTFLPSKMLVGSIIWLSVLTERFSASEIGLADCKVLSRGEEIKRVMLEFELASSVAEACAIWRPRDVSAKFGRRP